MKSLRELYTIGRGPSSSHTAGAVRLGRVASKLIDSRPLRRVEITLSGSFAQTYKPFRAYQSTFLIHP